MVHNVKLRQIYLFFLFVVVFFSPALLLVSCKQDTKPDVSALHLDVKTDRFDKDLYTGKDKDIKTTDTLLKKKYGFFYQDFADRMVGNGSYTTAQIINYMYKDQAYSDLQKEVDSVFKDLTPYNEEITQTFKYVRYYYPKAPIPRFIYFVSGFAVQTPIGEDYLGIGLDMFMGKDSKFYKAIVQSVPAYLSRRFAPEYLVPRVTETYAREELFPERDEDRTLLAKMIHNGKVLYFMDQVLPESVPDSVKIGYTAKQLEWCEAFEAEIWAYYLQNNLLFETNFDAIQVLLSDGPFTPGLGEKMESAPKLGVWTGWQIVRRYMEENKEVTLQQLMAEKDAQKILNAAKYKPRFR
ncbi:MAG TPA: gliding motility lipoprotein GldB [Pedobacter sp.]|nr:gliding motility lipoprotein GldB [Pedobacter sp.]